MSQYVEYRDGGYWITNSRVSLDSVVYAYQQGKTPENISHSFPAISLAQIYGAIAFYLSKQREIDEYLAKMREDYETKRQTVRDELLLVWDASEADEWINRIAYLPL